MEQERWLRPNLGVMAKTFGALSLIVAVSIAIAASLGRANPALSLTYWYHGIVVLSILLAALFLLVWIWSRRRAWLVNSQGIAVYGGRRLVRSHPWAEITSLHVLAPLEAVVRSARRPLGEELLWLKAHDSGWLREFACVRLGHGLVTWRRHR